MKEFDKAEYLGKVLMELIDFLELEVIDSVDMDPKKRQFLQYKLCTLSHKIQHPTSYIEANND